MIKVEIIMGADTTELIAVVDMPQVPRVGEYINIVYRDGSDQVDGRVDSVSWRIVYDGNIKESRLLAGVILERY